MRPKLSLHLPQYQCCRSVAFKKQVRIGYRLQNCSGHCRMSSFLKDPQCVAVRTGKHGSKTTAVLPLTQRVVRLQSYHTFLSSDEPCWQSCAARGRPRLSYREEHRNAPVKLAAAQAGPWHRPANYRPPQLDSATDREYPARGHTRGTHREQTNYDKLDSSPSERSKLASTKGKTKRGQALRLS